MGRNQALLARMKFFSCYLYVADCLACSAIDFIPPCNECAAWNVNDNLDIPVIPHCWNSDRTIEHNYLAALEYSLGKGLGVRLRNALSLGSLV